MKKRKIIFAAMSKSNFYLREFIIKYILNKGHTPTCVFMMFSYFMLGTVDSKLLIEANSHLVITADELWVFGEITPGVRAEIKLAKQHNKPIKYYSIQNRYDFKLKKS